MQLERCTEQGPETLDQFYRKAARRQLGRELGPAMLALIARLRALPDDRRLWGLTSLFRLCLLARDTPNSPWYVIVSALGHDFLVEYRMPPALAPWPGAYVRGEAHSEDDAVKMIVTAIDLCGGWAPGAGD